MIYRWRYKLPIFSFLLLLFCSPLAAASERITHFESRIQIQADRSLLVTERISVIAENAVIRHGIYREFPTIYPHPDWGFAGFQSKVGFALISVKLDGRDTPWTIKNLRNGIRIYIGDPARYVSTGPHRYEIQYSTNRQISQFDGDDLLKWNVNGQGWRFPIDQMTATVYPPNDIAILDYTAWTGKTGSVEADFQVNRGADGSIRFKTTRILQPYEGLTISLKLPDGMLLPAQTRSFQFILDNIKWIFGLLLILAMPLYYLRAWSRVGRDPEKGVVVADYHPVRKLSAAAHHFILHNKTNNDTFTAAILGIAVKGHIRIEQLSSKRYTLYRLNPAASKRNALSPGEKIVFSYLFIGNLTQVDLGGKYSRWVATGKRKLETYLKKEWRTAVYMQNRRYTWTGLMFGLVALVLCGMHLSNAVLDFRNLAALLVFLLAAVAMTQDKLRPLVFSAVGLMFIGAFKYIDPAVISQPVMIILSLLVAIQFAVFNSLLKAPTPFGRKILDEIEGFRLYLSTAEQHRLNILHPPEKTPALFEQLLPYAIALGVENQWSDQFSEVFKNIDKQQQGYSPSWYSGRSRFNAGHFGSKLGSGLSSSVASSSTAPSSRSSGGMSSGGAGGGGGGGGGGGW